jgi:hypothetical protein
MISVSLDTALKEEKIHQQEKLEQVFFFTQRDGITLP